MSQRTPLYDFHIERGAKMVEFAGWDMPVSYPLGLMGEHKATREGVTLFDVSHMAQVELRGADAAEKLEALVPSAITTLPEGKARYTFFTNENGGILDDLIVSNAGDHLYLVSNAGRADHDLPYLKAVFGEDMTHRSDLGLVALQGPGAEALLAPICPEAAELSFMETTTASIDGVPVRISRLGYTGEDGFEISMPADQAEALARKFVDAGAEPAGLGARDSLRMEAGLCLYGQDIDESTSPIEAGLTWAIQKRRREKGGFPGHGRISRELAEGPARRMVGILPDGRAPARAHTEVTAPDGTRIGEVTSGGFAPTLGAPISIAYVDAGFAEPGTEVALIVRGKPLPGRVTALPFVKQNYKR
ncbi:glycine cleavage system aminomethyltransferase GcvT [Oceanibium sediminis]|uniref:glycine cleavage system aminomethyltransferase GcvT n=1 Tax=Oceanibium sediminis TaxID=2026339 RepID=UPI000DD36048|nr:glycine cleavage system aminomethyltransferase GcvT [Oceanibium sediminis]